MEFYFSKQFYAYGLGTVDYWMCQSCGFVISKTHVELSDAEWEQVNSKYHGGFLGTDFNADDPRWLSRLHLQANVLDDLTQLGILSKTRWLDFACGDGKLASILKENYHLELLNYDKYAVIQKSYLNKDDLLPHAFDFVITTSVFEHILKRQDYDQIASLVSENGVMGLHTLVREAIPKDPDWFYLLPVHCAFHTNKSMSLLFQQWGYQSAIYNVDARLWLFFKTNSYEIEATINKANQRENSKPKYIFKNGFVDYWK